MNRHLLRYLTPAPEMFTLDTQLVSKATGRNVERLAITLNDVGVLYSDGREKWIRRGFPMDFASIPPSAQTLGHILRRFGLLRGVNSLDPTDGATLLPVTSHDADYSLQDHLDIIWGWMRDGDNFILDSEFPNPPLRTRLDADKDLRDGLRITAPPRAMPYYRSVHYLGYWSWHKKNAPLMDHYVAAVKAGTCDQWIAQVKQQYGSVVDLRAG